MFSVSAAQRGRLEQHLRAAKQRQQPQPVTPVTLAGSVLAEAASEIGSSYAMLGEVNDGTLDVLVTIPPAADAFRAIDTLASSSLPLTGGDDRASIVVAFTPGETETPQSFLYLPVPVGNRRYVAAFAFADRCKPVLDPNQRGYLQTLGEIFTDALSGRRESPAPLEAAPAAPPAIASDADEFERRFLICYQPIVPVAAPMRPKRAQALLRWIGSGGDTIGPAGFVHGSLDAAMSALLDTWVVERCVQQADAFARRGNQLIVHAGVLRPSSRLLALLERFERPRLPLVLEFREATVGKDRAAFAHFADACRRAGARIAISLGQRQALAPAELAHLPLDILKIGMRAHEEDRGGRAASLCALGAELDVDTVAYGVQTQSDLARARELGFDYAQGYAVGAPMSALDFADWAPEVLTAEAP